MVLSMKTATKFLVHTGMVRSNGTVLTQEVDSLREAKRLVRSFQSLGCAAKAVNAATGAAVA